MNTKQYDVIKTIYAWQLIKRIKFDFRKKLFLWQIFEFRIMRQTSFNTSLEVIWF